MNTQPLEMLSTTQSENSTLTDSDTLFNLGFSSDEVISLIWLHRWYQTGGSDRVEIVRHLEFLQHLVHKGKISR